MAATSHASLKAGLASPQTLPSPETIRLAGGLARPTIEPVTGRFAAGGLDEVELRRRWWHMSPGLAAMLLWIFPHADPVSPTLYGIFMLAGLGFGVHIFLRYRKIAREGDTSDRLDAVAGYACTVLAMVLCFPGDIELALVVLAVLAFGDGSATLFGKIVQGPRLPWNREKTWSGLAAFVVVGGGMASVMYWSETKNPEAVFLHPVPLLHIIAGGFLPAIAGALVESVRSYLNDNIRVGLAAGITASLFQWATLGIS